MPEPARKRGSVAERICAGRDAAEIIVEQAVDALKRSNDGATLPRTVLRQMIDKNSQCSCAIALKLLAERGEA
jgi:hypothetical protein